MGSLEEFLKLCNTVVQQTNMVSVSYQAKRYMAYSVPSLAEFILFDSCKDYAYDTYNRRYINTGDIYLTADTRGLYFAENDPVRGTIFTEIVASHDNVYLVERDPLLDPIVIEISEKAKPNPVPKCIWKLWFGTIGTGLTDSGEIIDLKRSEYDAAKDYISNPELLNKLFR